MKFILFPIAIFLFIITSNAQSQTISEDEYEKVFRYAVTETNSAYPLIFTVKTEFIENGKTVRTVTTVNENEAFGYYRIKKTTLEDGKEKNEYQITHGLGNVYCSEDGVRWTPPSEYECGTLRMIGGPREAESTEYSVNENLIDRKKVKVYRKYEIYPSGKDSETKDFSEKIATIDSRGFFIKIVDTRGTIEPKTVTLKTEQSWITKAKIKPVVPPIKSN